MYLYLVFIILGGNRGSFASMGKPTSSTLASLAGLFKERDERAVSQIPDGQTRGDERCGEVDSGEKDLINQRVKVGKNTTYTKRFYNYNVVPFIFVPENCLYY